MDKKKIVKRFSGFLPVVVDCETGGVDDPDQEALLEVAACPLEYDAEGLLCKGPLWHYHVQPFEGAVISEHALAVTQIKPDHPFRFAVTESIMAQQLTEKVNQMVKAHQCRKAVMVGHNAQFDLNYLKAAFKRSDMVKAFPFHDFVTFDTATISALWLRETVLARALHKAGIDFDTQEAHSALYDCERTATLVCQILNQVDVIRRY